MLVLIFLVFHDLSYLWHGRHVNDIAPPGPEHVALGERRESGPLQRDHGALAVHGETQFVAGVDHDLAGTLAERRAHGDVADAAKGALSVAGLIVESLGRGNYVTFKYLHDSNGFANLQATEKCKNPHKELWSHQMHWTKLDYDII